MEIKKIRRMFQACRKACYDQEFGWSFGGHAGGNAVWAWFNDKHNINLAAGWNEQLHGAVCELMREHAQGQE